MTQPMTKREKIRIACLRLEKRRQVNMSKYIRIRMSEAMFLDWKNYCEDNAICSSEIIRHLMLTLMGTSADIVDEHAVAKSKAFLLHMISDLEKAV